MRLLPLLVTALVVALGCDAGAATLSATRHGSVDLGDRVAFTVSGKRCSRVAVQVRVASGSGVVVNGSKTRGRAGVDGACHGIATVPSFTALQGAGWRAGDPLDVSLVSAHGSVPLRYVRMEADAGTPAAGAPRVVPAGDQDTGSRDRAYAMRPGDAIALGRVDLRRADGLAVRLCAPGIDSSSLPDAGALLAPDRVELPAFLSVRQDGPQGAPVAGPTDVAASEPQETTRLSTLGFGGCYRLVIMPITGRLLEDAPPLFLRFDDGNGPVRVNSVDVTGGGARVEPAAPPAPRGMQTIFDGTRFGDWQQTGCILRDGAAVSDHRGDDNRFTDCVMTYPDAMRDVVIRMRLRRENIYDNAGIYLGDQEIQLRSVGEYGAGGYFGQFAARAEKLSAFPDYDEVEIIQLGARHVISIDGRTVTDVVRRGGPPPPYLLRWAVQSFWSYRLALDLGFGNELSPDVGRIPDFGAFWLKDVRLLRCAGPDDPVCRRLADARRGQVPVPAGAPPAVREASTGDHARHRRSAG